MHKYVNNASPRVFFIECPRARDARARLYPTYGCELRQEESRRDETLGDSSSLRGRGSLRFFVSSSAQSCRRPHVLRRVCTHAYIHTYTHWMNCEYSPRSIIDMRNASGCQHCALRDTYTSISIFEKLGMSIKIGWGSFTFGTTKCITSDNAEFWNFEYRKNEK